MKNTLTDLNNHLFAQIERLGDEKMTAKQLDFEDIRTKNIVGIAKEVIANGRLVLDSQIKLADIPQNEVKNKILT